jgi:hypothetical protein
LSAQPSSAWRTAGAACAIHGSTKSRHSSGAPLTTEATPPQWAWPMTTMRFTFSTRTPNSSAADTPWRWPSGS